MSHGEIVDHLADILVGLTPDFIEHLLDALGTGHLDLESVSVDDILHVAMEGLALAAGTGAQQYIRNNRAEVRAAITRALAADH
jgi:hypothetical protein